MMTRQQMLMAVGDGVGSIGLFVIVLYLLKFPCVWSGEWFFYGTGLLAFGSVLHIPYFKEKKADYHFYILAIFFTIFFIGVTILGLITVT